MRPTQQRLVYSTECAIRSLWRGAIGVLAPLPPESERGRLLHVPHASPSPQALGRGGNGAHSCPPNQRHLTLKDKAQQSHPTGTPRSHG